jgi:imidazolonepropionase-like amidohydrolase
MLAFRGATLIDGRGGEPVRSAVVVVDGGRVTEVGTGGPPAGADVLELEGLTLLPGLIDAHVHLGLSSDIDDLIARRVSLAEVAARIFRTCGETLDAGFTTVRDCGGVDGGLLGAIRTGLVRGPRVVCAGPIICQTGGHGLLLPPTAEAGTVGWPDHLGLTAGAQACDGPDEIRRAAREAFRRGASFLKLCVSGGVVSHSDSLEDTQFTVDEIRAAVGEARARHTYVTVHSHNADGIKNAVAAGVRCVEHGTYMDEETAALMARHGVSHVPTLAVTRLLETDYVAMGLPKEIGERVSGVRPAMSNAIRMTKAAGVVVGAGSDLIGPLQDRRGLEIALRAEVTDAMEAIVASTATNARILGLADEIGTVEVGKRADLIAVRGDPLAEPSVFDDVRNVRLVVRDGVVVKDTRRKS